MNCKKCNKEVERYDNAFHKLCKKCNIVRLEASKQSKPIKHIRENKKSLRINDTRLKHNVRSGGRRTKKAHEQDEWFYEQCFNSCSNHECEECGKELPTEFRNEKGSVINKSRYSHIIAKSIAPELRHDINNINHLCFDCHFKWDFGKKTEMKIYEKNKERFPKFLK